MLYLPLITDVKRAHHLVQFREEEWGTLAYDFEDCVYLNKIGTCRVYSAAGWRARLVGAAARAVCYLVGPNYPLPPVVHTDDVEEVGAGAKGRAACVLARFLLAALGFPAQRAKTRGAFKVAWLGPRCDHASRQAGLSEARATGLVGWRMQAVAQGKISTSDLLSGLGRLDFAAMVLRWEEPVLGPVYAWAAAHIQGTRRPVILP